VNELSGFLALIGLTRLEGLAGYLALDACWTLLDVYLIENQGCDFVELEELLERPESNVREANVIAK
jgi:hypothetical protein